MEFYKDRTKSPGQRAEDLLGQAPLRSVYEVLGELAARTIRIAIARGEIMRTRDVIDGRVVRDSEGGYDL